MKITMHVDELDGEVDLHVEYHYFGNDEPESQDCPASAAELNIDSIKSGGYMVDELLSEYEFEELEQAVDAKVRAL